MLLELEGVSKAPSGPGVYRPLLCDVSFALDAGERVAVWGAADSGRAALLRIAAGVEPPDDGVVRFDGRDLATRGGRALGSDIGYCVKTIRSVDGRVVQDQLVDVQVLRGVSLREAQSRAHSALHRVGAESNGYAEVKDLGDSLAVRVVIARALVSQPRLLVFDEPTFGMSPDARKEILSLLNSLSTGEGIAVLTGTEDGTTLSGVERVLSLSEGELHGKVAPVLGELVRPVWPRTADSQASA